jgi:hypothetical protein
MAARSEGLWCLHTPEHEGIVAGASAVDHIRAVRQTAAPGFSWCPCPLPPRYRVGGPPASPVSHARPGWCQSLSRAAPTSARPRSLPGKASATSRTKRARGRGSTSTGNATAGACGSAVADWSGPYWGLDRLAIYVLPRRMRCDREPDDGSQRWAVGSAVRCMHTSPDMTMPV